MYTCRECEREINQATEVCPHCGTDLSVEPAEPGTARKKSSMVKTLLRYAILLGAIWGFLLYVMPERRGRDAMAAAESSAIEALLAARAALEAHAAAQEGTYPLSLEALTGGPLAAVRQAAQAAQREGYRLEYTPGPENSGGQARHFVLLARPGNFGYRNFFLDQTGVIRSTRENRPANAQDPPL